jgi:hypothetical protein
MGNCAAKRRAAEQKALLERQAQLESAGLTGSASNLINTIDGAGGDLHGASSGYGDTGYVYATYCPEGIPEDVALLATAAALAAGLYIIYRQILIQTAGRRKKRSMTGPKRHRGSDVVAGWIMSSPFNRLNEDSPLWTMVTAGRWFGPETFAFRDVHKL